MPGQQFDELQPYNQVFTLNDASTPNAWANTAIDSAGLGSVRIDEIRLCNNDTIDHTVGFSAIVGVTGLVGFVVVPTGAGHGAVPSVDALASLFSTNNHFWTAGNTYGGTIAYTVGETINTGKVVTIALLGGAL